jgi:Ca2+-binding RTX toxin-like protein
VLTVSKEGSNYVFLDSGARLVAGVFPCQDNVNDPTPHTPRAQCPDNGVEVIQIFLNNGNDQLKIEDTASKPGPAPGTPRIVAMGGDGMDSLLGGAGPERLEGGPGDDMPFDGGGDLPWVGVDGGGGDDELIGGTGKDLLRGGEGNDRLDFGAEGETVGGDILDGGPGDDLLNGGPARQPQEPDILIGGVGTDTADYSQRVAPLMIALDDVQNDGEVGESDNVASDVEKVIGGSNRDILIGSDAPNVLDGRDGDDTLAGGGSDDRLEGGAGNDSMTGEGGGDTLMGADGDDGLGGGDGNDNLSGGGGSDALAGEGDNDTLAGGAGIDRLDGGAGGDSLNGGEVGLVGGDGGDQLNGGAGPDLLLGGPGDDRLDGGPGGDQINGEQGSDTLTYEDRTNPVTVTLDGLPNDGEDREGDNVGADVEIILGGTVWDTLTGDRDPNTLRGGSGEDLITGKAGPDVLDGGEAPDLIWARDGDTDAVDCGDDGDLAIVDRGDTVRGCKWIDQGGKRRLTVAKSALVRAVRSEFGLRLPVGQRFYKLDDPVKIPIGSTIDAREGEVRLGTARNSTGARQEISASRGVFRVRQQSGKRPVTELRLVGSLAACGRSATVRRVPKDQPVRRLATRVDKRKPGRYRVRGRYSIGAATGTAWVTEERCEGTFTRVRSGVVRVRDLERKRTRVLHAGESYLARPR